MRRLLCAACLPVVATLVVGGEARAHPTPGSVVFVDFTVDGARVEQDVPVEELERALRRPLAEEHESAQHMVQRHRELLRGYAAEHLRASSLAGGRTWDCEVVDVVGHDAEDGPRALFRIALRAPDGDAMASLRLADDIVAHEVVSHHIQVYVRSDWSTGQVTGPVQLVGTVHAGRKDVTVTRSGSLWRAFGGTVSLGAEHIRTGTDHVLFLFALVLVAPVAASARRWRGRRRTRDALMALCRVVSAFTVGHSATLALGALGVTVLPSVLVEACVAGTILISAAHALRPIFPRREAFLAGAFGLIHGLAFASAISERDLGWAQTVWTLLGFNVGIELAQLGLLALATPWLLLLARTRAYDGFRIVGAAATMVLSVGWLIERTTSLSNPTAPAVAWLEDNPVMLLVAVAAYTLLALAAERWNGGLSPPRHVTSVVATFRDVPAPDGEQDAAR
ncbi:MAG: HupE/UreJ family protein [Myxococcota bacterium]